MPISFVGLSEGRLSSEEKAIRQPETLPDHRRKSGKTAVGIT